MSWLLIGAVVCAFIPFAFYTYLSSKCRTSTHIWHFVQYITIVTFVSLGVVIDRWVQSYNWEGFWHDFGNLAVLTLAPALISYIGTLRILQRWELFLK